MLVCPLCGPFFDCKPVIKCLRTDFVRLGIISLALVWYLVVRWLVALTSRAYVKGGLCLIKKLLNMMFWWHHWAGFLYVNFSDKLVHLVRFPRGRRMLLNVSNFDKFQLSFWAVSHLYLPCRWGQALHFEILVYSVVEQGKSVFTSRKVGSSEALACIRKAFQGSRVSN